MTELDQLIQQFSKLPGLGKRSAQRLVLHLLTNKEQLMQPLTKQLAHVADTTVTCQQCGNVDTESPCHICTHEKRQTNTICVVEDVADLWAMERSNAYHGLYHVLGGTLSAIDQRGPEQLNIETLISRAEAEGVTEIILATSATMDGQTTAHYLSERLKHCNVATTQLAQGIPFGGELDYLDEGTLLTALNSRKGM